MDTGERIKKIRQRVAMNRNDFAQLLGIPLRTLEDWEADRRKPPEYVIRLLAYYVYGNCLKERNSDRNISVIQDTDGNKIVVIHDIIFRNKQKIAWEQVEKYLKQYVGEFYTIADDNEVIYIGEDLPDEYTGSKYTRSLKGGVAKAKANAVQAIPELIAISNHSVFDENHEEKHNRNAKFGWYRYDARFAIAVYNRQEEVERYNVFKARMIIRHSEDGKKYIYDIINIKKESEYPA